MFKHVYVAGSLNYLVIIITNPFERWNKSDIQSSLRPFKPCSKLIILPIESHILDQVSKNVIV